VTRYNLEKLAADMGVLRRFARRNIWSAPDRSFGPVAEGAMSARRELARELRVDTRRATRAAAHKARVDALRAEAVSADRSAAQVKLRASLNRERLRGARDIASGEAPEVVRADTLEAMRHRVAQHRANASRWGTNVTAPPAPLAPMTNMQRGAVQDELAAARSSSRMNWGANNDRGVVEMHGPWSGPEERLMVAMHERNEGLAQRGMLRRMGLKSVPDGGDLPRIGADVLPMSTHQTPSVPLRDVTLANTATGAGADKLRDVMRAARLTPGASGQSELGAMGEALPGAKRIMQGAGVLPGAPAVETPRYVAHARQRLAEGDISPVVEQRLRGIVSRHEAASAVGPGRFNRNELRLIDDEFHRKFNPGFPQLRSRV